MLQTPPLTRDLVLVGGGHAHALVLRMWGMRPLPGARLTLINPGPTAPYTGMLPGHIAGHYPRAALDIDLVRLARFAGARLILGAAEAIDPAAQTVSVTGRGPIGYDVCSIDIGIHSAMDLPGFADHAIPAKPLDRYADAWAAFCAEVRQGGAPAEIAVIGGGIAGVELALAMHHALRDKAPRITVIDSGPVVAATSPAAAPRLARALSAARITTITCARVDRITPRSVELADGRSIPSRFTVGAAGAAAHGWLAQGWLPLTPDGYLRTRPDLRLEGQEALFAAGDCAHLVETPRPKAGVYAVRAAKVLHHNLRAALTGTPLTEYRPQGDHLKLISLGGKSAIAEKWGRALAAPALWRWKDQIDRRFMRRLTDLPRMAPPPLPHEVALGVRDEIRGAAPEGSAPPMCGGCGSKVGPGTLSAALARLPGGTRADVLSGPGDDAAILDIGGQRQVVTTDHLRAFTEDAGLMARITAVHALGDIWSMGAGPQAALLQVILPRMSQDLQARTMAEILREAGEVLSAAGAEIVGGHSTMGAELTLGFTLTGLAPSDPITQAGARAADALILTRPIGSGTLLAAEMQGRAEGRDIAALLGVMATPQGDAAALLAGAHAMTDVTGFGLAGHLMGICRASGLAARLDLAAVPLYPGALALAEAGHRSTIWPANRAAAPVPGADGARGALLHDPQTAGGLLAAVDPAQADSLVAALRGAGHQAAHIGRLDAGAPEIALIRAPDLQ